MIDLTTVSSIALRAIKANKMRSILTSLGIIIGVAAVIVMLSIGNGAQISLQNEMKTMGSEKGQFEELVAFHGAITHGDGHPIPIWQMEQATKLSIIAQEG